MSSSNPIPEHALSDLEISKKKSRGVSAKIYYFVSLILAFFILAMSFSGMYSYLLSASTLIFFAPIIHMLFLFSNKITFLSDLPEECQEFYKYEMDNTTNEDILNYLKEVNEREYDITKEELKKLFGHFKPSNLLINSFINKKPLPKKLLEYTFNESRLAISYIAAVLVPFMFAILIITITNNPILTVTTSISIGILILFLENLNSSLENNGWSHPHKISQDRYLKILKIKELSLEYKEIESFISAVAKKGRELNMVEIELLILQGKVIAEKRLYTNGD